MAGSFRIVFPGDIEHLAANLRPADIEEYRALRGDQDTLAALRTAVMVSDWAFVFAAPEPVAIFGVAPTATPGVGSPWLLGTERMARFGLVLVREGRRYVRRMLAEYRSLANVVDARNETSICWLIRLGFTVGAPEPMGPAGHPFRPFWKVGHVLPG